LVHIASLATHPSIYFSANDLPRLRSPTTQTERELHAALAAGAGYAAQFETGMGMGHAVATFAVDCAVLDDDTICTRAKRWLLDSVAMSAWEGTGNDPVDFLQTGYVGGVAVAYDILSSTNIRAAGRLSSAEQATVRSRLASEAARLFDQTASGTHPAWWANDILQNHNWENVAALGLAALALHGELSPDPTCTWLKAAIDDFERVDNLLRRITDGTWHEGYSYDGSSVAAWLRFVAAFSRAKQSGATSCSVVQTARDFADVPWLRAYPHMRATASLPGQMHQSILMFGDFFGWAHPEQLFTLRFAARYFRDGEAQWLADEMARAKARTTWGYGQLTTALELLLFDGSVAPVPPTARSLALGDLAAQIERSGYGADATVMAVKAGAYGGLANWEFVHTPGAGVPPINFGHDHNDDLSFWLYGNGQWLAPEGVGYSTHGYCTAGQPYVWNTSFHNTLTVDGVGQIGDDDPCHTTSAPSMPATRAGRIFARTSTETTAYVGMDGLALYPGSLGLDTVSRQVLFVDRSCVAVRDVLSASQPHRYEWHTHALDRIVRDGDSLRAEAKRDQALAVTFVAPEAAAWSFAVESQRIPHSGHQPDYIDDDQELVHARVWNTNAAREGRFLAVMCPTTTSGWTSRRAVEPIGDVALARGFTLADATGDGTSRVLFGDSPTSLVTDGGSFAVVGVVGAIRRRGGATTYILVRGTELRDGETVLTADVATGGVEARVEGATVAVSSDGVGGVRVLAPDATAATWNGQPVGFDRDPADARYLLIPSAAERVDAGAVDADGGVPPGGDPSTMPPSDETGCACSVGAHGSSGAPFAAIGYVLVSLAISYARFRRRRAQAEIQTNEA
jgi:hypothetical protein